MNKKGYTFFVLADMCTPKESRGDVKSHECLSFLNLNEEDCEVTLTLYYRDSDPVVCKPVLCPSKRSVHMPLFRFENADGTPANVTVPYSGVLESTAPVFAQYSRVVTCQPEYAITSSPLIGIE